MQGDACTLQSISISPSVCRPYLCIQVFLFSIIS